MRFALTTEQLDFAASLRDMLSGSTAAIRSWADGDSAPGRKLLSRIADSGVTALAVPERSGGLGAGPVDLVVAFVELGRAGVPGPLVETAAAVPTLLTELNEETLAAQWLAPLAAGTALAALVLPPWVPRAADADVADLVLVLDGDRLGTGTPVASFGSVDPARHLFEVAMTQELARGAAVARAAQRALDVGALAAAAQLWGAGRALLDVTTDYARSRVQFGRPIGSFQAIKHQLADVLVALEMSQPLLYGAAVALASGTDTNARDVSAAKVAAGAAAYRAARTALQVHGAIGYTAECDLSLCLTKVRALQASWGTAAVHRARIAAALAGT